MRFYHQVVQGVSITSQPDSLFRSLTVTRLCFKMSLKLSAALVDINLRLKMLLK